LYVAKAILTSNLYVAEEHDARMVISMKFRIKMMH
jgi:hypothetical protein